MLSIGCSNSGSSSNSVLHVLGSVGDPSTNSLVRSDQVFPASSGVDPSSVIFNLYEIRFYISASCTGSYQSMSFSQSGVNRDFVQNASLGFINSFPDDTYNCVVFKMDDTVEVTPADDIGPCTEGESFSLEICRTGESTQDFDGNDSDCTTDKVDTVYLYISTNSTGSNGNDDHSPFTPPQTTSDPDNGIDLTSALVVSSNTTAQFNFGANGLVMEDPNNPGECGMERPSFGFSEVTNVAPEAGACMTDDDCDQWELDVASVATVNGSQCVNFINGSYCSISCNVPDSPLIQCQNIINRAYDIDVDKVACSTTSSTSTTKSCETNEDCYCSSTDWF